MFALHKRLAADCIVVGDFPLCRLLLMNDANYPWFIMVPRREEVREIYELSEDDQSQLLWESCYLSQRMVEVFKADKLNVAALGNVVAQLHIHHIARYTTDAAWPAPVWGQLPARPYAESDVLRIKDQLRRVMTESFSFAD